MDYESAILSIKENIHQQDYRARSFYPDKDIYLSDIEGKYLKPYVPYVGKSYFTVKPRVLIYGMAQNFSKPVGRNLMKSWIDKTDEGMHRLYYDAPKMNMGLWDSGNLKVISALAMNSWPNNTFSPTDNVYDSVAVTNFVKISFYQLKNGKRKDVNPPLEIYDDMWRHYCKCEIYILKPNIIIGCGNVVTNALRRNLKLEGGSTAIILKVPFPVGRPLPKYIHDGKQFMRKSNYNPTKDIDWLAGLMKGTPDEDGSIRKSIERNWYFLRKIRFDFEEALK